MAGVFQLPVIFVCQTNQWAISVPQSKQNRSEAASPIFSPGVNEERKYEAR
jgi:TPP-dependent pyruvate/acetoin dehydrogenase alpha subunit